MMKLSRSQNIELRRRINGAGRDEERQKISQNPILCLCVCARACLFVEPHQVMLKLTEPMLDRMSLSR